MKLSGLIASKTEDEDIGSTSHANTDFTSQPKDDIILYRGAVASKMMKFMQISTSCTRKFKLPLSIAANDDNMTTYVHILI